jgi:hypothetical protein
MRGDGACQYWLPIDLKVRAGSLSLQPGPAAPRNNTRFEALDLGSFLDGQVNEIFRRPHSAPRSGLTSLKLPDGLLGGWANFDEKAVIDDRGLRGVGGVLRLDGGLQFRTPQGSAPNCCFLSHWQGDRRRLELPLNGSARSLCLLLACTTFPQATRSLHGLLRVSYADGGASALLDLRSPTNVWPIEQDYLIDDYVFRLEPYGDPMTPLPIRVDLRTASVRTAQRAKGGHIPGGSATVLQVQLDPGRPLSAVELSCERYGVVLAVLAITLARA